MTLIEVVGEDVPNIALILLDLSNFIEVCKVNS